MFLQWNILLQSLNDLLLYDYLSPMIVHSKFWRTPEVGIIDIFVLLQMDINWK